MATPTNLYQYYTQKGEQLPLVQERSKLFEQYGLGAADTYSGLEGQNVSLLEKLMAGKPVTSPIVAPPPAPTNVQNNQQDLSTKINSTIEEINKTLASFQQQQQIQPEVQVRESPTSTAIKGLISKAPIEVPIKPDLTTEFETLRTKYGTDPLEAQLTDLDTQIETLNAQYRTDIEKITGRPATAGL